MIIALAFVSLFGSIYALWIFYLAVMSLKRARDAGKMSPTATVLGYPVLLAGLLLDLTCNVLVMTLLLLELPREGTVTARLKRHALGTGWRRGVAIWFAANLLDTFDPSGKHV